MGTQKAGTHQELGPGFPVSVSPLPCIALLFFIPLTPFIHRMECRNELGHSALSPCSPPKTPVRSASAGTAAPSPRHRAPEDLNHPGPH